MKFKEGDRVTIIAGFATGTVVKTIGQQGRYSELCVVEWDDRTRGHVWSSDLEAEEAAE